MAGLAAAQQPEQHWQATQNYPPNNGPNYQPPNNQPASGNPRQPSRRLANISIHRKGPTRNRSNTRQPMAVLPRRLGRSNMGRQPSRIIVRTIRRIRGGPAGQVSVRFRPAKTSKVRRSKARRAARYAASPLPAFSAGDQLALENLLTDWEKRNKEIHVLKSKFFHWRYDAVFGNGNQPPPADEGDLKFAAPDKAWMWVKAKDHKQSEQWLCDGKSVFHWDYTNSVVTEYIMPPEMQGKGIGDGPLPFVFGIEAQKLKQRYFMRIITPPNVQNEVWLEAFPRLQQDAANYYKVEVILQIVGESHALFPYAIQIYAPNEKDRIVYQLQSPEINPRGPFIDIFGSENWKPSIPFGWTKRTELPQSASPQAGANPAMLQRR